MTNNKWIAGFSFLLLSSISAAADIPSHFPKNLIYNDQPIDALCFYEFENANGITSLKTCGINGVKGRKIIGQDKKRLNEGYIGYEYTWSVDGAPSPDNGFSYYKAFSPTPNISLVYTLNNGGGSGIFSAIDLIHREDDKIHLSTIASGDRCNNGIYDVRQDKQKITYNVYLTAYDFLELTHDNPHHFKPYDDLESCAACCYASATFELELKQNSADAVLKSVKLNTDPDQLASNIPSQLCFNTVIEEYKKNGKTELTPADLVKFTNEFNATCGKKSVN